MDDTKMLEESGFVVRPAVHSDCISDGTRIIVDGVLLADSPYSGEQLYYYNYWRNCDGSKVDVKAMAELSDNIRFQLECDLDTPICINNEFVVLAARIIIKSKTLYVHIPIGGEKFDGYLSVTTSNKLLIGTFLCSSVHEAVIHACNLLDAAGLAKLP